MTEATTINDVLPALLALVPYLWPLIIALYLGYAFVIGILNWWSDR